MNVVRNRCLAGGFGVLALATLVACAVTGVGLDVDGGAGYVGGYYEPYGYDYGGWGRNYHVGPVRGGGHVDEHGGDRGGEHGGARPGEHPAAPSRAPAYRPAPAGRSAPSIPGRSRGH
jgi:hypothetical protein